MSDRNNEPNYMPRLKKIPVLCEMHYNDSSLAVFPLEKPIGTSF